MVHLSFLTLKLILSLEEAILGVGILITDLKMIFLQKAIAASCCIELTLGIAILAVAAWPVACI